MFRLAFILFAIVSSLLSAKIRADQQQPADVASVTVSGTAPAVVAEREGLLKAADVDPKFSDSSMVQR